MNPAAAAASPKAADEDQPKAPKVEEIINLVSDTTETETEDEFPMSHSQFLAKRAELRRAEWTEAQKAKQKQKEPYYNNWNQETPVPGVFVDPSFVGPPVGTVHLASFAKKLAQMARGKEQEAAATMDVEEEIRKQLPVCYMMHQMPVPKRQRRPPQKDNSAFSYVAADDEMALILVVPCARSGVPFPPGDPQRYPVFMDQTMGRLMRQLRKDFPLEEGMWLLKFGSHVVQMEDTPQSLGIRPRKAVEMKLLLCNIAHSSSEPDPEEEHGASAGAAAAAVATNPPIESSSSSDSSDVESMVVSLEVWWGPRKCMTVKWGVHRHMWRLSAALAVWYRLLGCHLVLFTEEHISSGVGCVIDSDTPHSLSLTDGDMLIIQHLPNQEIITPHFKPSLAVAEGILKISGFHIHGDSECSEGDNESVDGCSGSMNDFNHINPKNTKFPNLHTEFDTPSIKGSINTSTNMRKTVTPVNRDHHHMNQSDGTQLPERRDRDHNISPPSSRLTSRVDTPHMIHLSFKDETSKNVKCDPMTELHRKVMMEMERENSQLDNDEENVEKPNFKGKMSKMTRRPQNTRPPDFDDFIPDLVPVSDSSSDEDDSSTTSTDDTESEDLLNPRNLIRNENGLENFNPDHHGSVITTVTGNPSQRDSRLNVSVVKSENRTKSEEDEEGSFPPKNRSKIYSPKSSLSTAEESSGSETDIEGSLPQDNVGPRLDPPKEQTLVTTQNKKRKRKSQKRRKKVKKRTLYSETPNYRLLQTYLTVMDRHGKMRRVKVALDTQSNVSYAKTSLGQRRSWRRHESKTVRGIGGNYENSIPLTTYVIKGKRAIPLDTRSPPPSLFDTEDGPEMLLSAQHCAELSIDMNHVLQSMRHRNAKYLDEGTNKGEPKNTKHSCLIAEKVMMRYMEKNGGTDKEPKQCTIDDVVIADDFTPEQKHTVKAILNKYKDVFASSPDDIPPPMKGVEPHVFKMKQDVQPIYCKRPNWGPHQRKFLELWTKKAIRQGLLEPAPKSQWASRPVLVGKYRGKTAKTDVPDGIRVCVDFTAVNEFIVKQPPQYTDPYEEMRKACGHTYYFEADGQKQFNSILLAEESRDITTTWTPLGLMRWLRLIMGTKDASARAQQEYANSMSKHLTDEERNNIANFQDDFLGFHDEIPSLLRIFAAFLKMCRKSGIMLNPAKIRIGIRKCKFYGFLLSKKGMEPSEKNLDPVEKMTIPKNSSEVRSVLGVFNQFRHFFERYDRLVLPIQKLLRKNEPFIWSEETNYGFDLIRKTLLSGKLYLAAPNRDVQLILETDGSDDGWGAILLQIIDGKRSIIKMWSKQWKTLHMKRAPPYYKETAAWMNGLERSRIYLDYSRFPVRCVTDHIPLTYVKNTSGKGPVSQFVLDNLSSLDYTIEYRQGSKLVEADAISRFPCLGPRELSPDGVKEAFNILLVSLPNQWSSKGRVWVFAQKETEIIQQLVREWLTLMPRKDKEPAKRVPYTESVTVERIRKIDYGLALWAPPADKIPQIVNAAFNKDVPFACLVSSCLINLIPDSPENKRKMDETTKLVLLSPEVTWIVHNVKEVNRHQVYSSHMDIESFGSEKEPINGLIRPPPKWNFGDWSTDQEKMVKASPEIYTKDKIYRRESDGFITYQVTKDTVVALVPEARRSELVLRQHHILCHASDAKVYNALKHHWHWPDMKSQVRDMVRDCAACQLLNAKRARAHRHFRAKVFCTPRTSWGCDYYGVAESTNGHNNVLGAMDLATSECRLFACKGRTAPTTMNCILHGIVLRDGCPLHLHSDAAREFLSKIMKKLCSIIGCKQTTTLAHHPTGNAAIERLWQFVARCLRLMSNEQYKRWEKYVRLMEFVWNTTFHNVLKCTPFEAAHGLPARSVLDTYVEQEAKREGDLMTSDGIEAMKQTARAFEKQIYLFRKEAAEKRAALARKGSNVQYKVGDEVSLFIPPTEQEAKRAGRKAKHLLFFRGPAIITEVLSVTTYKLDYEGRAYYRCFSELRPYKSSNLPVDLPIANNIQMQEDQLILGNFVSLCDTDDENDIHFHLCKVVAIEDNQAVLLNYATYTADVRTAKFKILYQEHSTNRYTTKKPRRNAREQEVLDKVPLEQADDYIDHYNLKLTENMCLTAASIKQLKKLGLKHHILGGTFP